MNLMLVDTFIYMYNVIWECVCLVTFSKGVTVTEKENEEESLGMETDIPFEQLQNGQYNIIYTHHFQGKNLGSYWGQMSTKRESVQLGLIKYKWFLNAKSTFMKFISLWWKVVF